VDQWVASRGCSSSGLDDHPLDICIADLARAARTRLIVEAVQARTGKAPPPAPHPLGGAAQPSRDLLARLAIGGAQHDPAAQRQRLRALGPAGPALGHLALLVADHDLCSLRHDCLPSSRLLTMDFAADRRVPAD